MNLPPPPICVALALSSLVVSSLLSTEASAEPLEFEDLTLEEAEQEYEFSQTRTCMPSGAHRCEPGKEPLPVSWDKPTVAYEIHVDGSRDLHPGEELTDDVKHSVIDSFDTWNQLECSDFEMIYAGKTAHERVGWDEDIPPEDNLNLLLWQDDHWPYAGINAVALTTVTFNRSNGEILTADIEFNTAEHTFTDSDQDVSIDLRNTLTHEVGHFLGLDHSPNRQATMYATAPNGETSKRELHQPDIAGLCYIYPEDRDYGTVGDSSEPSPLSENGNGNGTAERSGSSCSTIGGSSPLAPFYLLVLGFLLILGRKKG